MLDPATEARVHELLQRMTFQRAHREHGHRSGTGEARTVRFEVSANQLGLIGLDMHYTIESGEFCLWIASNCGSGLEGHFGCKHLRGRSRGYPQAADPLLAGVIMS